MVSAMAAATDETLEVNELMKMISHGSPSKRPNRPRVTNQPHRYQSKSIGPGWDSTPHRNRPRALKGLVPTTEEPWMRSEYLNMDPELEFVTTHTHLMDAGKLSPRSLAAFKAHADSQAERMGNRLLQQKRRKEIAERRARIEAVRAARREEEARIAAELEARRQGVERELIREAEALDAEIRAEVERQRRAAAQAAAEAAAREAEEREKAEAEERAREEEAQKVAAAAAARKAERAEQQKNNKPKDLKQSGGFGKKVSEKGPAAKPVTKPADGSKSGSPAKQSKTKKKRGV